MSPFLNSFLRNEKLVHIKNAVYIFTIAGIAETATEYLVNTCANDSSFTKWVPYTGIFIFGYLVGTGKWKFAKTKLIKFGYLIGLVATIVLNYIYFSKGSIQVLRELPTGCISQYSDYYLSINVLLMSVTAFILLINFDYKKIRNTIWEKIIYAIARASFGIYLVNLVVVTILDRWFSLVGDNVRIPLWSYVIIKLVGVLGISYVFTVILMKIKGVRRIIGESK